MHLARPHEVPRDVVAVPEVAARPRRPRAVPSSSHVALCCSCISRARAYCPTPLKPSPRALWIAPDMAGFNPRISRASASASRSSRATMPRQSRPRWQAHRLFSPVGPARPIALSAARPRNAPARRTRACAPPSTRCQASSKLAGTRRVVTPGGAAEGRGSTSRRLGHRRMAACGYHFSAAVTEEGDVLTWGKGSDAQLGLDDRDDKLVPTPVSALASAEARVVVVMVACGYFHSAAVAEDGILYTWGAGALGRCDGARARAHTHTLSRSALAFSLSRSPSLSPPPSLSPRTHARTRVRTRRTHNIRKVCLCNTMIHTHTHTLSLSLSLSLSTLPLLSLCSLSTHATPHTLPLSRTLSRTQCWRACPRPRGHAAEAAACEASPGRVCGVPSHHGCVWVEPHDCGDFRWRRVLMGIQPPRPARARRPGR